MVIHHNNIQVFYRVFPTAESCWDLVKLKEKQIFVRRLQESKTKHYETLGLLPFWEFSCNGVFTNTVQQDVYQEVTHDLLESILKGSGVIITAYGQTGAGKSFTLGGLELEREENIGIVPKFITKLFGLKSCLPKHIRISYHMSYLEFSQHEAFDLLQQYPNSIDPNNSKRICTKVKIRSDIEALRQLYIGEARKTIIDYDTYYSHVNTSVVTFYVTTKNLDFSSTKKYHIRIHIIDYSGLDTVGNASSSLKSASQIGEADLEKTNLEILFLYLTGKETEAHSKNKLNPLLSFLGEDVENSQIRFIGHIKITKEDLPITLSILKFGQMVQGLKLVVREYVFDEDDRSKSERLQDQLDQMKLEKIQDSILLNQDLGRNLNDERIDHLRKLVKSYLQNRISEIKILNVAEASAVFNVFKEICLQMRAEKQKYSRNINKHFSSEISLIRSRTSQTTVQSDILHKKKKKAQSGNTFTPKMIDVGTSVQSFTLTPTLAVAPKRSFAQSITEGSKLSVYGGKLKQHKFPPTASVLKKKLTTDNRKSKSIFSGINTELLVDTIPENEEAWLTYNQESSYRNLYKEYMKNKEVMNRTYQKYLEEMKILEEVIDKVDETKNDLHEAHMFLRFSIKKTKSEMAMNDNMLLAEATDMCEDRLREEEQKLQQQQEEVLKLQSVLKLHLDIKKDIKKQINQDFRNFCDERFGCILPQLQDFGRQDTISTTLDDTSRREADVCGEVTEDEVQKKEYDFDSKYIVELKKLLHQEREKYHTSKEKGKISWK